MWVLLRCQGTSNLCFPLCVKDLFFACFSHHLISKQYLFVPELGTTQHFSNQAPFDLIAMSPFVSTTEEWLTQEEFLWLRFILRKISSNSKHSILCSVDMRPFVFRAALGITDMLFQIKIEIVVVNIVQWPQYAFTLLVEIYYFINM